MAICKDSSFYFIKIYVKYCFRCNVELVSIAVLDEETHEIEISTLKHISSNTFKAAERSPCIVRISVTQRHHMV